MHDFLLAMLIEFPKYISYSPEYPLEIVSRKELVYLKSKYSEKFSLPIRSIFEFSLSIFIASIST